MRSFRSLRYVLVLVAVGVVMAPTTSRAAPTTATTSVPSHPFTDISCPAARDCYAVGTNPFPGSGVPFVAHLSHGAWSFATPPWPSGRAGQLDAIDCYSTSVCVAVGSASGVKGGHRQDLALRLAHGRWHLETFPTHSADTMRDVSCAGRLRCVAVAERPNVNVALVQMRAGGQWTRTRIARPAGEPATTRLALSGISCATTSHCVAVGSDSSTGQPFTATLDAGSWTASPLGVPENSSDTWSYGVTRISCATRASCVAVGDRENARGVMVPLVSTLHGDAWMFATRKRLAAGNGGLADVDCLTTQRCFAVGFQGIHLLTESLHAGAWRGAVHPTAPSASWHAVSCRRTTCHAVGDRPATPGESTEAGLARAFAYTR